jgi:hypothetical protein
MGQPTDSSRAMTTETNPYQSPTAISRPTARAPRLRSSLALSAVMVAAGVFFASVSFYVVLAGGIGGMQQLYSGGERFAFGFMVFYGFAGAFTAVFHLLYLIRQWPAQHVAGIYALALAAMLTTLVMGLLGLTA